jgi:flagellar protein FlaJ
MTRLSAPWNTLRPTPLGGGSALSDTRVALLLGGIVAAVLAGIGGYLLSGRALLGLPPSEAMDLWVLALLALIGPYGFAVSRAARRQEALEHRLPDLLRDLTDSGRAGLGLAHALIAAGEREYGPLTPEVRRIARQIRWGASAAEALEAFARRIPSPLVRRTVSVVIRCDRAGGHTLDVLALVAEQAREQERSRAARRGAMASYVAVVYVAFFVFLLTIFILLHLFLPLLSTGASPSIATSGPLPSIASGVAGSIVLALFVAVVIHAVGDGIMVGVLTSGRARLGLSHATVLVAIGWVVLRFWVGLPGGG